MTEHDVSVKLPAVPLNGEADVVFKIKVDGKHFGDLIVMRDSLTWHPTYTAPSVFEVSWKGFDEWMRARKDLMR